MWPPLKLQANACKEKPTRYCAGFEAKARSTKRGKRYASTSRGC